MRGCWGKSISQSQEDAWYGDANDVMDEDQEERAEEDTEAEEEDSPKKEEKEDLEGEEEAEGEDFEEEEGEGEEESEEEAELKKRARELLGVEKTLMAMIDDKKRAWKEDHPDESFEAVRPHKKGRPSREDMRKGCTDMGRAVVSGFGAAAAQECRGRRPPRIGAVC